MDAVKRKLHGVRVLLHSIACLLRTARATRDAVGKSYPAVEETSHAVEESSHGVCVVFHGFLRARGVEAGEMLADGVLFVGRARGLGRSESDKYVVEHVRHYLQAFFLQGPYLLLTFAVRGQKS